MKSTFRIAAALLIVISTGTAMWADEAKPDPAARWENDIRTFEAWDIKNSVPDDAVLFVGSSSIRMWETHRFFPDMKVINRGFGGSQISDVNYYVQRIVIPYKPSVIVFYAGDNDIAGGKKAEQVLADYKKFCATVTKQLPDTKIIFISIKASGSRWSLWPEMSKANSMIEKFTRSDKRLYYVDAAHILLSDDGKPNDWLFRKDRLHLNDRGYERWTAVVGKAIDEAMGSSGKAR